MRALSAAVFGGLGLLAAVEGAGQGVDHRRSPGVAPAECAPSDVRLLRAGMSRFRDGRHVDAARLAERVAARCPTHDEAWELLAAARFLDDDRQGALRAWNRLGRPRVASVEIHVPSPVSGDLARHVSGLSPGAKLTPGALDLARRRLDHLPSVGAARVDFRPLPGGLAEVDVHLLESRRRPGSRSEAIVLGVEALVQGSVRFELPSSWNRGEVWRARAHRRGAARGGRGSVSTASTRLPGVWSFALARDVAAFREAAPDESPPRPDDEALEGPLVRERRDAAFLEVSHWWSSFALVRLEASAEERSGRGRALGLGTEVSIRPGGLPGPGSGVRNDWAVRAGARGWLAMGPAPSFGAWYAEGAVGSPGGRNTWRASLGVRGTARHAPRAVWPAAGTGPPADALLRAHPHLDGDGAVESPFHQPRLAHGGVELVRWTGTAQGIRGGLAFFGDLAGAWGEDPDAFAFGADVGIGLRADPMVVGGSFRLDLAWSLTRHRALVSAGWMPSWPGWEAS